MSSLAQPYIRRNYGCEAILVTRGNMGAVAHWCGGTVEVTKDRGVTELYIAVPICNKSKGRPKRAYLGQWVIYDADGFKVYEDQNFHQLFIPWMDNNPE
jgi:hypothetical protein